MQRDCFTDPTPVCCARCPAQGICPLHQLNSHSIPGAGPVLCQSWEAASEKEVTGTAWPAFLHLWTALLKEHCVPALLLFLMPTPPPAMAASHRGSPFPLN